MSELDEKEQAKILRHFLLNSPPAQFSNVERDLRAIVANPELIDRTLPLIAKRYNEEQLLVVGIPDTDTKILVSKVGLCDETTNEYYDPNTNTVVIFDHITKTAQGKRDATEAEITHPDIEPYRAEASAAFAKYVEDFYPDGVGMVYAKQAEGGGFTVTFCLSATKSSLNNRWSGRFRSTYAVTFAPGDSAAEMEGKLNVKIHYFEEGNVQLNSQEKPTLPCKPADPAEFAKTAVEEIEKVERAYQSGVNGAYASLSDTTFKQLRRKLPLRGQRFDFDNWAGYALGSEMAGQ